MTLSSDTEFQRLRALDATRILDSTPDPLYDDIVRLASMLCAAPIALVSLVDRERQWFKAREGLDATETPRDQAFCDHAIRTPDALMEVRDATVDARFSDNPLVLGAPHIRFYAGMPLITGSGHALGTLCVIDREPRQLDAAQREALTRLARLVVALMEARQQRHQTAYAQLAASRTLQGAGPVVAIVELQGYAGRVERDGAAATGLLLRQLAQTVQAALPEAGVAMPSDAHPEIVTIAEGARTDDVSARLTTALEHFSRRTGAALCHGIAGGETDTPMDEVFLLAEEALTRARSNRARCPGH